MLEAFKDIVPDISAIGTYSLRSGGATRLSLSLAPWGLKERTLETRLIS